MRFYGWDPAHPAIIKLGQEIEDRGIPFETRPFMSHADFRTSLEELAVGARRQAIANAGKEKMRTTLSLDEIARQMGEHCERVLSGG